GPDRLDVTRHQVRDEEPALVGRLALRGAGLEVAHGGAQQIAVGDEPDELAVVDHREVPEPEALHPLEEELQVLLLVERDHLARHDVRDDLGCLGHLPHSSWRTVRTGILAVRTTRSATLPRSRCFMPVRPCVPITIMSAFSSSATRSISWKASPSTILPPSST